MSCRTVIVNGVSAIVCGRTKPKRCGYCARPSTLLCDWKMPSGRTCDAPICGAHAQEVGPDKHLCPTHQDAYRDWLAQRRRS